VDYVRCENRYIPDEEVGLFFAAADTCVAPYVGGTQSAVVAMAQAYGKPVVMTEISAAGVDLSQFDPRVIVPAGDAPALAQAIRFQRSQPAATSRQAAGAESGWQAIVEAIESCVQP
jgi:glycosyltransferase involved in cell wall biosynthesis